MKHFLLATVLAGLCALSAAERPSNDKPKDPAPAAPRFSREQLERIRQSLMSQIAVRDEAEQALREATPAEAAALATSDSGTPAAEIPLRQGGAALRVGASQLSFAVAETGKDGKVQIKHAPAPTKGAANAR